MTKREVDKILLACRKHSIDLTIHKEGDIYLVTFINRIDIKCFEAAKLITNGLVVEARFKKDIKKHIVELETNARLNFSKYPTKKNRSDGGIGWGERRSEN